jgi:hypothetical protein
VGKNGNLKGLSPRTSVSPVNTIPQYSMYILGSMLLLTRRTDGRHVANLKIKAVSGIGEQMDIKHFNRGNNCEEIFLKLLVTLNSETCKEPYFISCQ